MTKWFVYSDLDYYPYAQVIEADTAKQAGDVMIGRQDGHVAVFPLAAMAYVSDDELRRRLES